MAGVESMIPSRRSHCPAVCGMLLAGLELLVAWLLDPTLVWETGVLAALSLTLGPVLYSLCLLTEEWQFHSYQRYGGSVRQMLEACFSRATLGGMLMVLLMLLMRGSTYTVQQWALVVLTCAIYLLFKTLGVLGPSPVEISEVGESRGLNVAYGLAWSFYLGYLKIVLPELQEQVNKHYSLTKVKLMSSQLHILIPLNAVVTAKLEEEDCNICFQRNLPELEINRAGVRNRVYKHSVYKITDENRKEYCCVVEYATPLLTLYQMSQDDTAGMGERERRQQVLLFYRTLSHILENSLECRNRYCLVLLDDNQAVDRHYLSKELVSHLQQQQREIPMELSAEPHTPTQERGAIVGERLQHAAVQSVEFSSDPSLMISLPRTLRSGPEENTDYLAVNHHHR